MTRSSAKQDANKVASATWHAEALQLRVGGMSIRQIAAQLGKAPSSVHEAIEKELAAIPAEAVATLREVEGARLDADESRLGEIIDAHIEHAKQEIILGAGEMPGSGADRAADVVVKAIAQRTQIRDRRAKLFGLNAKQEVDLSGSLALTHDVETEILDRLARLAAEGATSEDSEEPDASGEADSQA